VGLPVALSRRVAAWAAYVYLAFLLGGVLVCALFKDQTWWSFLLSAFAPYAFVPLPLCVLVAVWLRRKTLWATTITAGVVCVCYLVPMYAPILTNSRAASAVHDSLSIMTFNVRADNAEYGRVISCIRSSRADVVALQELTPGMAQAIARDLQEQYPHQLLRPAPDMSGAGTIARYPLEELTTTLSGRWGFPPQLVRIGWDSQPFVLLNVHLLASPGLRCHDAGDL